MTVFKNFVAFMCIALALISAKQYTYASEITLESFDQVTEDSEVGEEVVFDEDVVSTSSDDKQDDSYIVESEIYVSDNDLSYDYNSVDESESDFESESDLQSIDSDISGNDLVNLPFAVSDDIVLYSDYDSYYGSISSTYLEYMRGYLPKLSFTDHYVASRVSQYDYIFAYGDSLSFDGSVFSGTDITVVAFNTQNGGSFGSDLQSSFSLSPGSYLVYTDLSGIYPTLATSEAMSLRQIVIVVGILITFWTVGEMYRGAKTKRQRKRW